MTAAGFRRVALSMPEATESEHQGHPDFRVKGKIFATLFSRDGEDWGMVKLSPEQQADVVDAAPAIFAPLQGGWGRRGCTRVCLGAVDGKFLTVLRDAIFTAWCNTAPERLVAEQGRASENRRGLFPEPERPSKPRSTRRT